MLLLLLLLPLLLLLLLLPLLCAAGRPPVGPLPVGFLFDPLGFSLEVLVSYSAVCFFLFGLLFLSAPCLSPVVFFLVVWACLGSGNNYSDWGGQ